MINAMLARLACLALGHRLHVKQEFGRNARRVECLRCEREWAMHDPTRSFLPWDEDFAELYRVLGYKVLK